MGLDWIGWDWVGKLDGVNTAVLKTATSVKVLLPVSPVIAGIRGPWSGEFVIVVLVVRGHY